MLKQGRPSSRVIEAPRNGGWEIYIASAQSINRGIATYQVPRSGWDSAFPGVKWRFLDLGEGNWQAALFPQLETNALSSARQKDIAVPGPRWLLPLKVTKRLGSPDFEAGCYLPKK